MTLAVAFFAGLVSCVSPCVLPILPVFAGYVAGGTGRKGDESLTSGGRAAAAGWTRSCSLRSRFRGGDSSAWRAIGFLTGFLGVFVLLWSSIGVVGFGLLQAIPDLRQVAGALIVLMGLAMITGRNPFERLTTRATQASNGGPVLLGAGVAVGWTPCVGPTLGSILTLSAASSTAGAGISLLVAYSAGLAVPFLLMLLAYRRFRALSAWLMRHRRLVDVFTGALVVLVGVLIFTGSFARLAGLFNFGIV